MTITTHLRAGEGGYLDPNGGGRPGPMEAAMHVHTTTRAGDGAHIDPLGRR